MPSFLGILVVLVVVLGIAAGSAFLLSSSPGTTSTLFSKSNTLSNNSRSNQHQVYTTTTTFSISTTTTSEGDSTSTSFSSSTSTTTTTSITSTTTWLGNVQLVSYNDNSSISIYDSVNGYSYAAGLAISPNGTLYSLGSWVDGHFAYNSHNGTVLELYPDVQGHNGCPFPDYNTIKNATVGQTYFLSVEGLTGALTYNPFYQYFALAYGGPSITFGNCNVGLYLWEDNSSLSYVNIGPQPDNTNAWFGLIPDLAYNSVSSAIYVPILNYSVTGELEVDSTYLYTVQGYSVLPDNFTLPGQTVKILFDPANQYLYAEQYFSASNSYSLLVLNPTTGQTMGAIPLSSTSPVTFDSNNQMIYVFDARSILQVSGIKTLQTYQEPTIQPASVVYNSLDDEIVDFY